MPKKSSKQSVTYSDDIYLKVFVLIANRLEEISKELRLIREQNAIDFIKENYSE
jgi:hypothetical protein